MFSKIKEFFRYLWAQRWLLAMTMIFIGILDLIGINANANLGIGFILGFLLFVAILIAKFKEKPKVG